MTSNQTWEQIILFFSQDETTALKQFFTLFSEILTNVTVDMPSVVPLPFPKYQQESSEISINATTDLMTT